MLYEALHKRKVFLDAFGEGLEEFGVWSLTRNFPEEMKGAFVPTGTVDASDILEILKPIRDEDNADEDCVWGYLTTFIQKSPEKGIYSYPHRKNAP